MRRMILASLLIALGCGGDSTGNGSSANVKIIGVAPSGAVNVENIGGSGDFYLEFWSRAYPSGTFNPLSHISSSPNVSVAAGYRGTVTNSIRSTKIVAKSRGTGGSGFFTSDCYGTEC